MKRFNTFTWILIFFLVIGFFSALLSNFLDIIIPVIIFGLIFYFSRHPEKLNFLKNNKNNRQNQYEQKERKSSFTVIDGKFKDSNKK